MNNPYVAIINKEFPMEKLNYYNIGASDILSKDPIIINKFKNVILELFDEKYNKLIKAETEVKNSLDKILKIGDKNMVNNFLYKLLLYTQWNKLITRVIINQ